MDTENLARDLGSVFNLKQILFRDFDSSPLGLDLNKTEERVLMMAWIHGGAPMGALSRSVALEKGSLTAVIDSLEAKGLVVRARDRTDRRSFAIEPTEAGTLLARRIDALFQRHLETVLARLEGPDRAEFVRAVAVFARLVPILSS